MDSSAIRLSATGESFSQVRLTRFAPPALTGFLRLLDACQEDTAEHYLSSLAVINSHFNYFKLRDVAFFILKCLSNRNPALSYTGLSAPPSSSSLAAPAPCWRERRVFNEACGVAVLCARPSQTPRSRSAESRRTRGESGWVWGLPTAVRVCSSKATCRSVPRQSHLHLRSHLLRSERRAAAPLGRGSRSGGEAQCLRAIDLEGKQETRKPKMK